LEQKRYVSNARIAEKVQVVEIGYLRKIKKRKGGDVLTKNGDVLRRPENTSRTHSPQNIE
jgi:hypothetical protein